MDVSWIMVAAQLSLATPVADCNASDVRALHGTNTFVLAEHRTAARETTAHVLDGETGESKLITAPTERYVATRRALFFGSEHPARQSLAVDLVSFDAGRGEAGLFVTSAGHGATRRAFYLAWDLTKDEIAWHASLGEYPERRRGAATWDALLPVGVDPASRSFFFSRVRGEGQGHVLEDRRREIHVSRLSLEDRAIDWSAAFPVDGPRLRPGVLAPSADRIAFVEYAEVAPEDRTREDAVAAYVLEIPSGAVRRLPAPLTAYGLRFSPDGDTVFIGSNQLGRVYAHDLASEAPPRDAVAVRNLHFLTVSPDGSALFAFGNSEFSGAGARRIPWPSLEGAEALSIRELTGRRAIHPGGSAATDDGRYVLLTDQLQLGRCYLLAAR